MAFTDSDIKLVWEKGEVIPNFDSNKYRKDACGAWMTRIEYGNRNSDYEWEIDHISPGGPDHLSNLRPLHWINNLEKSDGRLKCNIRADGNINRRFN